MSSSSISSAQKTGSSGKQTAQTGISRFLIGEELGRGAYGQVYKGIDTSTGDVVAIKQISLAGVSQENLAGVMGEIDLLKTLNHKNIVKYIGSFKSRSHLYIILEYMENGALSSVIKPNRFGVFPETLVAIYIAQVLQGLAYLHDQGVVHRDIKGANILTTKDGLVKLADFGVAAKLGELEEQHNDELHQNVVGTPYWMAPEVIEMTQVTPASDIWSVGCLIIELLTGYPPYYDLQPMSALFRIVQDHHPPLPENVSPLLDDFLLKCFQKDPSARPDARSLLQHEWVQFNRKTLRGTWNRSQGFKTTRSVGSKASEAHETVNSVVARILQAEFSEDELSTRGSTDALQQQQGGGAGSRMQQQQQQQAAAAVRTIDAAAGPLASNTPARLALQQDTLLTASSSIGSMSGAAAADIGSRQGPNALQGPASAPMAAAAAAAGSVGGPQQLASADTALQQQQRQRQRLGSIELAAVANGSASPAESPRSGRVGQLQQQHQAQQQQYMQDQQQQYMQQQQQEYQGVSPNDLGSPKAGRQAPLAFSGQQLQYGPAAGSSSGSQAAAAAGTPPSAAAAAAAAGGRFSPATRSVATQQQGSGVFPLSSDIESPLSNLLARIQGDHGSLSGSVSAAGAAAGIAGGQSLLVWLEDGPSLAPGAVGPGGVRELYSGQGRGQLDGGGLFSNSGGYLLPGASSNSLDSLSAQNSQVGLELPGEGSFLIESKRKVRDLVRSLRPGARDAVMTPQQAAASLASMFGRLADSRQHFLSEGGVLAALELLDSDQARLAEAALDVLLAFVAADARLLESLCLVGLVPVVVRMAAGAPIQQQQQQQSSQQQQQWQQGGVATSSSSFLGFGGGFGPAGGSAAAAGSSRETGGSAGGPSPIGGTAAPLGNAAAAAAAGIVSLGVFGPLPVGSSAELSRLRGKAAAFVEALCFTKETTLQMFIACGGLRCLVLMVNDNIHDPASLTYKAVCCIFQVLETYGTLPLNYICRIFAHNGLVQRLYAVIKQIISWQRQQQQRGAGGYASSTASAAAGVSINTGGGAGSLLGLKLHHMHSPSAGSVGQQGYGQEGQSAAAGGEAAGSSGRRGGAGRETALAGLDELQQHRRAHSVDEKASAAAAAGVVAGHISVLPLAAQNEALLEKCLNLLLVLSACDGVVKGWMCSKDNLQQLLDLTQRLQMPGLLKVTRTMRLLTSEPSVLPAIKESGAIGQLVPFLSREREAALGQAVVLEALQALYNICKFNRRVHLEVAATGGIVPHLCRFASEAVSSYHAPQATQAAAGSSAAAASASAAAAAAGDPLADPALLSAAAASDARRAAVRVYVLPLLCGMVSTSSSTRAKLWASNGLDIFLQLLGTEEPQMQVGLMRTLDIWLAEDHSRVESRLCQREAVGQLVEVYGRLCRNSTTARSPVMPQMLDSLKVMLGRSSKVAVSLATGGLVPHLLEPLTAGLTGAAAATPNSQAAAAAAAAGGSPASAPILRAKLLEVVRIMYQHYPRPKEFIMKYRIQEVLLRLLESEGRGEDAVKVEAQKLLNAFHINVLL